MISLQKNLHLKRSREIAGVLIGHGWDNLLETFEHAGVGNSYHDAQRERSGDQRYHFALLTLERIRGTKINDLASLDKQGIGM